MFPIESGVGDCAASANAHHAASSNANRVRRRADDVARRDSETLREVIVRPPKNLYTILTAFAGTQLYRQRMTEPTKSAQQTSAVTGADQSEDQAVARHYDVHLAPLSPWRRAQVPVLGFAGYALIRAIGPTLRFEVLGQPNIERVHATGRRAILAFWHRAIFSATWWWRGRGIVVLNSANFDGQWTRRVIERLGFATAQGSSSRGGLRGLAEMARSLDEGHDVAFTIDGPRGPRYVAKPGPAMLARRSGCPIIPFHIGVERGLAARRARRGRGQARRIAGGA
jgi:hypothetical protein